MGPMEDVPPLKVAAPSLMPRSIFAREEITAKVHYDGNEEAVVYALVARKPTAAHDQDRAEQPEEGDRFERITAVVHFAWTTCLNDYQFRRRLPVEFQLAAVAIAIDHDGFSRKEVAREQPQGKRILHQALDRAP